jgi:hypothetical protein
MIRACRNSGRTDTAVRGWIEHHRDATATASRTAKPFSNAGQRKIPPASADQGLQVELGSVAAVASVLQTFAAAIQTAYADLPT